MRGFFADASDPAEKRFFWYSADEDQIMSEAELFNTVKASEC